MSDLKKITELSHKFGTELYVKGGGGNTSVKDENTLWVKPSGTCLSELTENSFVAMDRAKLSSLYQIQTPTDPAERERLVKDIMADAVLPESTGRASVEAPLHNALNAIFVVHTHPALVNGLLCAKMGEKFCKEFFPTALWMDYIDPGYTLCMKVRQAIKKYKSRNGTEPKMIFLKNHGLFIAADTSEEINSLYESVFKKLKDFYKSQSVSLTLQIQPLDEKKAAQNEKEILKLSAKHDFNYIISSGYFEHTDGPLTPDHLVYAKSYYLCEKPTEESIQNFIKQYGYFPHVISYDKMVFGLGQTENKAQLALELARDGALVKNLADAFGGVEYMTKDSREFIENWEVESYRSKQV